MRLHTEILGKMQGRVLARLGPILTAHGFYLCGGTAAALHLGHRKSFDLDWFRYDRIADPLSLGRVLADNGIAFQTGAIGPGTLHGHVARLRVSLLEYPYPMLAPLVKVREFDCQMSGLSDLAAMKIAAIANRGAKKDFTDVYALGKCRMSLAKMIRCYQKKYRVSDMAHVLYSLTFFDEADRERIPPMLWDVKWPAIKATVKAWVDQFAQL